MINIGITTILKAENTIIQQAKKQAQVMGYPYVEREGKLVELAKKTKMTGFLIYGKTLPLFWTPQGVYQFHLGTAVLRIGQIKKGKGDRLCHLLPEECHSVLDCTFGHGGDSVVFSYALGEKGKITALEKSPIMYEIGKVGITSFSDKRKEITEALRRIDLRYADFQDFLKKLSADSFDVVYFDTMFVHPVKRKENKMEAFRMGAIYDTLSEEILKEACRVAKYKVIVKERPFSKIFQSPLFLQQTEKHSHSTVYGVIDLWQKKN